MNTTILRESPEEWWQVLICIIGRYFSPEPQRAVS